MSGQILQIKNLRVESINGTILVDDTTLDLKPGEVLGLIGESGAGKSTIGLASMFYARAAAMGGAWTFGTTDNLMLTRIAERLTDYIAANYDAAVGGPTGQDPEKK